MQKTLSSFFHKHADLSQPILLAVSGGPDSLALLYLLLEFRKSLPLKLGIAHVDHSWRQESKEEAAQLAHLAEQSGLPFHSTVLDPREIRGNLENECRLARLSFFKQLCLTYGYQAVVLAHHADDVSETVLKRLFEGAQLLSLSGMTECSLFEGLTVWRPLLGFSKKEILKYLEGIGKEGFEDSTNLDPKYLRGRFRSVIIPLLSQHFGKEISKPLQRISSEVLEWKSFLEAHMQPHLRRIEKTTMGYFCDVGIESTLHSVEKKYLLKYFCERASITISSSALQKISDLLFNGRADKQISAGKKNLYIDRGRLFAPRMPLASQRWRLQCTKIDYHGQLDATGWKAAWSGHLDVYLPEGDYSVGSFAEFKRQRGSRSEGKSCAVSDLWTHLKVPAFFRGFTPVIWSKEELVHEFLTGRSRQRLHPGQKALGLSFSYGSG